jgi:hypothetical protein
MLNNTPILQKFNIKGIKLLPLKVTTSISKKSFKKKIFFKKKIKKHFNLIKKKKKLSLIYKIFSLNNQSFFYKLRRKILKNFLKIKEQQNFLKLKLKLKQLHFLTDTNIVFDDVLKKKEQQLYISDDYNSKSIQTFVQKKVKFFLLKL